MPIMQRNIRLNLHIHLQRMNMQKRSWDFLQEVKNVIFPRIGIEGLCHMELRVGGERLPVPRCSPFIFLS